MEYSEWVSHSHSPYWWSPFFFLSLLSLLGIIFLSLIYGDETKASIWKRVEEDYQRMEEEGTDYLMGILLRLQQVQDWAVRLKYRLKYLFIPRALLSFWEYEKLWQFFNLSALSVRTLLWKKCPQFSSFSRMNGLSLSLFCLIYTLIWNYDESLPPVFHPSPL